MVAVGCRVVTQRGLVPIEYVAVGELVLTHRARFRRVTRVGAAVHNGDCMVLGALTVLKGTWAAQNWAATFQRLKNLGPYDGVSAVLESDWSEAERRSVTLEKRPAGMVITTAAPQIVLGLAPAALFGRILFASNLEGRVARDDFKYETVESMVIDLVVEEDNSFVCERLALRTSRA